MTTDPGMIAADTRAPVLEGGGQIASRGSGDIPALPAEATSVPVETWPPANWGPKLYQVDASGNRTAAARPGE
jgi:hypothetical protein